MKFVGLILVFVVTGALGLGCSEGSGSSAGGGGGSGGDGGTAGDGGEGGEEGDGGAGGQPAPDPYAANICVAAKQAAAASFCQSLFDAHATWLMDQDDEALADARESAATELGDAWQTAESSAEMERADCSDLALASSDAGSSIDSDVDAIVNAISDGLDLGQATQVSCGAALIDAAGTACQDVLDAEAEHIGDLYADSDGSTLDGAKDEAFEAFLASWDEATSENCPTNATRDDARDDLERMTDELVANTVVTPGLDDEMFISLVPSPIEYLGRTYDPQCMQGSEYRFFAKRGSVNKLVMYYQGGGACWDNLTCGGTELTDAICATTSTEDDNPNNFSSGFADFDNENNPFRDWHMVFVSYCTCDVHFGDVAQDYSEELTVQHKGYHNAKVAEKWAREHFLNPEEVFVTGSSAGAYGAWFNGPLLHEVWPASQIHVLADAGNGVITMDFLENEFENWNFRANLPDIPGVLEALEGDGMAGYTSAIAKYFPDANWAHYSTLYDGGRGGQTGFYNVMLKMSPIGALTWWEASCVFGENALAQSEEIYDAVPSNYRYYFGTGSRHTMWGNNKVYDDTTGGVPPIVDWVNAMLASGPDGRHEDWKNVECENCGLLLEGDPRPDPLEAPFEQQGEDTVIVCE